MAKRKYLDEVTVLPELYVSPTSSGQYVAGYDSKGNRIYTTDRTQSIGYELPVLEGSQDRAKRLAKANRPNLGKEWADIAQIMIGTPLLATAPATNMGLQFGNKVLNNPLTQAYFTYDAIKNSPKHIKDIYNRTSQQRYLEALGNTGLLALDILGIHGAKKGLEGTGRRAVETVMRTTNFPNPLLEVKNNFKDMLRGRNGGKKRLYDISNYVITGNKTGTKGWYNSFANLDFQNKVRYYDAAYPAQEGNDLIDAFLYGKTIDENAYGLKKVAQGKDFGIHKDYVNKHYKNKRRKIQVYETTGSPRNFEIVENLPKDYAVSPWYGKKDDFYTGKVDLNVAGHLAQNAYSFGRNPAIRQQDIWKFNPKDYYKKWTESFSELEKPGSIKQAILNGGLHIVDYLGTPVIIRTPWVRHVGPYFKWDSSINRPTLANGGSIKDC